MGERRRREGGTECHIYMSGMEDTRGVNNTLEIDDIIFSILDLIQY